MINPQQEKQRLYREFYEKNKDNYDFLTIMGINEFSVDRRRWVEVRLRRLEASIEMFGYASFLEM